MVNQDLDQQESRAITVVRWLKWAAIGIGLVVAIAPMTMRGYFAYEQALEVLQEEAQRHAAVLALRHAAGPAGSVPSAEDWLHDQLALALLSGEAEAARVVEPGGGEVGRSGPWQTHLAITAAAPVSLTRLPGAELELQRPLTPVLINLAVVGAVSSALGLTIYLLLAHYAAGTLLSTLSALGSARRDAEAATRARSAFLATMSHEIRTPMNGVVGMASLLAETELNRKQRHVVDVIRASGASLVTIINDILDFSRIESGKLQLDPQPFCPQDLVEEVLALFAVPAAEKQLDLLCRIDPAASDWVCADVTRLRQILTNLVGNAVKFTEHGEVVLAISSPATDRLHFEVRDTGIGVSAEQLKQVFSPFVQADASTTRRYGGTGLGLAICDRLVQLMGGELRARSEVGTGSVFSFDIVAVQEIAPSDWMREHDPSVLRGHSVLFVDDNVDNLDILRSHAALWGMRAQVAQSGQAAMALLARPNDIDMVVLDFNMPVMDGVALARWLKAKHAQLPLVLLSSGGSTGGEVPADALHLFFARLDKPVRRIDLMDTLIGVLHRQSPDRASAGSAQQGEAPADGDAAPAAALRVLVVEDNEVNALVFRAMLERVGMRADWAGSGEQALPMAEREDYELVFMDVQLPGIDGLETTRRIRQMPLVRQPYIAALTANAMQDDRNACHAAGMNAFISKPVTVQDLRAFMLEFSTLR